MTQVPKVGALVLKQSVMSNAFMLYLVTNVEYERKDPGMDNHEHWLIDLWNITKGQKDWIYPIGDITGGLVWSQPPKSAIWYLIET
jgi:hypothetical protein